MKRKNSYSLILLGYCVPYAFLAMYADAVYRTLLLYGVLLAAMWLLCRASGKINQLSALVIGNVLSCVSSCIFVSRFLTDENWGFYFKPLRTTTLVLIISAAAFLIQLFIWPNFSSKKR